MRVVALALVVPSVVACATTGNREPRPFAGALPPDTRLDLGGEFQFSPDGELTLALAAPCTITRRFPDGTFVRRSCNRERLDAIHLTAVIPWGGEVPGVWTDASHLLFRVDWKTCGLDPLADDAASLAARPWIISSAHWQPTASDAARILKLVGDATQTESELVIGGAAPSLEVAAFDVAEGSLRVGGEATLVVRVVNRGPGIAYRVVATTRSSIPSLHGLRLSFGTLKPSVDKTRQLRVTIPETETSPDTMLVLVLGEGNGFIPKNVSRRMPIQASPPAAVLALQCSIAGRTGARPELDAGDNVVLHCTVGNAGTKATKVELETSVAHTAPARSPIQDLAAGGQVSFDVPVAISRDLALDSTVEIAVIARDRVFAGTARASVVGIVRKPKVCTTGQLTHEQYRAKLVELRAAVTAGDLTQAQLDRYDAELVSCLQ
jgi:hypothetical protein